MPTADQIMLKMGFPETETGPYVTELRAVIARQVSEGMTDRSAGTWTRSDLTAEDRAHALLEWEWATRHGHCYRVENIDGYDSIDDLPAWAGDRWRLFLMKLRIWRDKLLLRRNPYSKDAR